MCVGSECSSLDSVERKKKNVRGTVRLRICCMSEIEWRMAIRSAYIILVKELERK